MRKFIYDTLRERIVSLHYKPGESLNEKRLAEEFHISRTPIREALIRLSAERLVAITPNLGARVSEINLRDFQELIELRVILEKGVARLAAKKITDEEIQSLEQLCDATHKIHQSEISELIDCDLKFHQVIQHASHNNILGEYLCIIQNQFFRIQKLISHKPVLMLADLPKIIEALKARDANKMEELMINHVENFVKDVRKHFKMED